MAAAADLAACLGIKMLSEGVMFNMKLSYLGLIPLRKNMTELCPEEEEGRKKLA